MTPTMKLRFIIYWVLPAIGLSGCKKLVQVGTPETQLSTEVIFSSDETAVGALMGMYSKAVGSSGLILNGGSSVYPSLSADECVPASPVAAFLEFSNNNLGSANNYVSILYSSAYSTLYDANILLENLPLSSTTAVSMTVKRQLNGEARFMRALLYCKLVDLYGDVPLETSTNADVNATMPRTASTSVYAQVLSDLNAADTLLDTAYASAASQSQGSRTRPNRWAASALLARLHLYKGEWAAAEQAATAVINSGYYLLEPSLDSVFRAGSREAIWQMQPVTTLMNSGDGYLFLPLDNALSKPPDTLSSWLSNAFETGDLRKQHWVGTKTIGGISYRYPAKYKVRAGPPYVEYEMVLRLAEVYLIRAEARARNSELTDAIKDLNVIRNRAGLSPLPDTLDQLAVFAAVAQERRIELFAEWGHRWSDLRRTGAADTVLGLEKPGWAATDALYPMPAREIQRNANITQNLGYK